MRRKHDIIAHTQCIIHHKSLSGTGIAKPPVRWGVYSRRYYKYYFSITATDYQVFRALISGYHANFIVILRL